MRITVDIDDKKLSEIQRITGLRMKSPAVNRALDLFLRESKKRTLLDRVREGKTDYPLSNDELEDLGDYDSD
jgi:Arc/MetJ family transcription regulator